MKRRAFLAGALAGPIVLALAGPGRAASLVDDLVAELRSQGFREISVSRTMLGRVKIAARSASGSREIVLNPNSGEILRDLWTRSASGKKATPLKRDSSGRGRGQSGGDDTEDDDGGDADEDDDGDDADDDDDDDNGGGGNSGSGGGDDE